MLLEEGDDLGSDVTLKGLLGLRRGIFEGERVPGLVEIDDFCHCSGLRKRLEEALGLVSVNGSVLSSLKDHGRGNILANISDG